MTDLRLSSDLALPVGVVTEPIGIFANRGKGKSNAAHLLVEQLFHAGLPTIVLDVKGDWFGIRSSRDGRSAGLPFLVLGGEHGDVPLDDGSGRITAQLLAEQRVPTIVDLSRFSKTKARQWVMEFAEALYRVNRDPLMLVVDEADVLIPQRLSAEMMRLLGAMEDIAKRGRQRGLGICVISQRVADVNKSVTDLLETLLLFAVTGVRTRKALLEWIDDHADPQQAKDVIATLSSLPPGECWVWSPGWLHMLRRTRLNRIETFDSHATPEPGKSRTIPRTLADVDLAAFKEAFADTIEKVKADDPRELRKRIHELETQLARTPEPVVERIEVPVFTEDERREVDSQIADMRAAVTVIEGTISTLIQGLPAAAKQGVPSQRSSSAAAPSIRPDNGARLAPSGTATPRRPAGGRETRPVPPAGRPDGPAGAQGAPAGRSMGKAERSILTVLAQYGSRTKQQVAILAGYSHRGGGFNNALSSLRTAGLIEGRDVLTLTDAGAAHAVDVEPLPTGQALIDYWSAQLGRAERLILQAVLDAYPASLTKQEVADATGYAAGGGGFSNALSKLRGLELIHGRTDIVADVALAEAAR